MIALPHDRIFTLSEELVFKFVSMNINDFVRDIRDKFEEEIRRYIHSMLDDVVIRISMEYEIPIDTLREHVQDVVNKSVRKCSIITKM